MNIKSYKDFQNDAENGTLNGFYANVPNEDYHKSPGISKSGLDLINKSPAHYKFAPPRKPSAVWTCIVTPVGDRFINLIDIERHAVSKIDCEDERLLAIAEAIRVKYF